MSPRTSRTSTRNFRNSPITSNQQAVLSSVLTLDIEHRKLLDKFFLLRVTGFEIDALLNDPSGDFMDYSITLGGRKLTAKILNPGLAEELMGTNSLFLISVRICFAAKLYIALIKPMPDYDEIALAYALPLKEYLKHSQVTTAN